MKDLSGKERRVLHLADGTLHSKSICSLFPALTSKPSLASLLKKQLFTFPYLRYFLSFNPSSFKIIPKILKTIMGSSSSRLLKRCCAVVLLLQPAEADAFEELQLPAPQLQQ